MKKATRSSGTEPDYLAIQPGRDRGAGGPASLSLVFGATTADARRFRSELRRGGWRGEEKRKIILRALQDKFWLTDPYGNRGYYLSSRHRELCPNRLPAALRRRRMTEGAARVLFLSRAPRPVAMGEALLRHVSAIVSWWSAGNQPPPHPPKAREVAAEVLLEMACRSDALACWDSRL